MALIALLTDFGVTDTYVGQIKAVIAGVAPAVSVIDLTHAVRPQQVRQGAFLLETALATLPGGSIVVAVIDPGVGTARRAIAVANGDLIFVGPDNGLLSGALPPSARPSSGVEPSLTPLPAGVQAVELTNPAYRRQTVSNTFHGRDLFAPAAAHLALGVPLAALGPPLTELLAYPPFRALPDANGSFRARAVHIDHYGNIITDTLAADLPARPVTLSYRGHTIPGLATTYQDARSLVALTGSSGHVEITLPNGDAARLLGAEIGDEVEIAPQQV